MPAPIRRIAQAHLRDPAEITITAKTSTATNIRQRYWWVSGMHKLDALTRILEVEPFDAMLVFSRTKLGTEELAGKLQARGFSAAAINGDVVQAQRERLIQQLKDGRVDIHVATDVAARGLDVERISHVLNYDIPHDTESYVHRIGRTGRAGRSGEAILFVTPREKHLLRAIERATRQPISEMQLPSVESVNDRRISRFKQRIGEALGASDLHVFRSVIEQYEQENNVPAVEIAAALARLAQGDKPLLLDAGARPDRARREREPQAESTARGDRERGWPRQQVHRTHHHQRRPQLRRSAGRHAFGTSRAPEEGLGRGATAAHQPHPRAANRRPANGARPHTGGRGGTKEGTSQATPLTPIP
jgi:ATP-dependent RNA helicase DeaD